MADGPERARGKECSQSPELRSCRLEGTRVNPPIPGPIILGSGKGCGSEGGFFAAVQVVGTRAFSLAKAAAAG